MQHFLIIVLSFVNTEDYVIYDFMQLEVLCQIDAFSNYSIELCKFCSLRLIYKVSCSLRDYVCTSCQVKFRYSSFK